MRITQSYFVLECFKDFNWQSCERSDFDWIFDVRWEAEEQARIVAENRWPFRVVEFNRASVVDECGPEVRSGSLWETDRRVPSLSSVSWKEAPIEDLLQATAVHPS